MDAGVVIVGAGPVGLMLAGELCLAGVRPLIPERQPRLRETPKASGFNGQIVDLAGQVKLVKVNVDTSPQVSQRFGVQAIPTLLVLRRGQVAARQTGAVPLAALRTWVDNALAAAG